MFFSIMSLYQYAIVTFALLIHFLLKYLLETTIKVGRSSRHNGLYEKGLLTSTFFISSHNTEAPALVVGF